MQTTRKGQSSYLDKETFLGRRTQPTTSLGESSSTPKRSPWPPLERSPPNTKGIKRCSAKKSRRGYPSTRSGTTPSNCSQGLPHHCQEGSSPLLRARL